MGVGKVVSIAGVSFVIGLGGSMIVGWPALLFAAIAISAIALQKGDGDDA